MGMALRERADPHALDLPDGYAGVFYAGQRVVAVDGFTSTATATERRKLSGFIRTQRQMANLWLRPLCALGKVSNPYLSQVERGLHDPSVRVPKSTGEALNVMSACRAERARPYTVPPPRTRRSRRPRQPRARRPGGGGPRRTSGAPGARRGNGSRAPRSRHAGPSAQGRQPRAGSPAPP